ncbi:DNA glycosylase [Thermothelomyces heterothallicus CBS 202.75]|uniref:DNA glycosylase n=1 Tax=Thermothelomyces heterothallicus CBS 202.75 TaxID=1149848 RepID=UPI0037428A44
MGMGAIVTDWRKLPLSLAELCIETTLRCGQSFRWRKINEQWHCVLQGRLISLKQDSEHLHYRVIWPKPANRLLTPPASVPSASPSSTMGTAGEDPKEDDTASLLHNYFALSLSLSSLYQQWAASDANFARRAPAFTGIRILNQDAWEALVAFICSSNNNISRISQMVQKLCIHYGPYIGTVEGEPFHDFPAPEALSGSQVEAHLRQLGFGYRAKYIAETARIIASEKPRDWLQQLRNPACPALGTAINPTTAAVGETKDSDLGGSAPAPQGPSSSPSQLPTYRAAHEALLTLPGVGPKVADCVCLMGLGWGEAVPIDTHVWQIAQRDYGFGKKLGKSKTFSKAMYDAVGDHFRAVWGPHAGWAQSVLFTANLRSFAGQAAAGATGGFEIKKEEVAVAGGEGGGGGEDLADMTVDAVAVVKVEEGREKTGAVVDGHAIGRRSRKRKVTTVVQVSEVDRGHVQAVEVSISTRRRTSKRIKPAGR